jgi:hypothetical protein
MTFIAYYPKSTRRKPVQIEANDLDSAETKANEVDPRWDDIVMVRK